MDCVYWSIIKGAMESEASVGTSHVVTSATTTSSHELDLFSITVTSNFVL